MSNPIEWRSTRFAGIFTITEFIFAVYRVYDAEDRCLYVGSTAVTLAARFRGHMRQDLSQRWINQADRIEYAEFSSYTTMLSAEQASIDELRPKYNAVAALSRSLGSFTGNAIRRWAWDNGLDVKARGKISPHIIAAYEAANSAQLLRFPSQAGDLCR